MRTSWAHCGPVLPALRATMDQVPQNLIFIEEGDASLFAIDQLSSIRAQLYIVPTRALNYEVKSQYTLKMRVR